MAEAKAGDVIGKKARNVLRKTGHDQESVMNKGEGNEGQWFCIDCGLFPENNFQAIGHASGKYATHPKHRLAWRSFVSGKIEEA